MVMVGSPVLKTKVVERVGFAFGTDQKQTYCHQNTWCFHIKHFFKTTFPNRSK